MKILLMMFRFQLTVEPYDPNRTERFMDYLFPLGLPYISAVLKKAGKDVDCVNLNHIEGRIHDVVKDVMENKGYDIVFLGGLSLFYPHIKDTILAIRKASPKTMVVVGGGLMSSQPEIMFDMLDCDVGVIGEGEQTALELVEWLDHSQTGKPISVIDGLIYRAGNEVVVTKPRQQFTNLDALPFPDYDSFGFYEHLDNVKPTTYYPFCVVDNPRYYPLLASRSCTMKCSFCYHPIGDKYVQRSVDNVMAELKQNVEKYNTNVLIIYDELFTYNEERLKEFCTKFKAYSDTRQEKLWFYCNTRVDNASDEQMKLLKESGAFLMTFGLESYSKTVLDSMKKHTTPEQINKAVHLARANNLGIQGSFIFGDTAETMKTAMETISFLKENHKVMGTAVSSVFVIPFQGSEIYKRCVKDRTIPGERQFIEERAKNGYIGGQPLNMTRIPEAGFERLKDFVFTESLTHGIYATPIASWTEGKDTFVQILCPWCGKVSTLKNMPVPGYGLLLNVGCRHCFYRFDMVSDGYDLITAMTRLLGYKRTQELIALKKRLVG